MKARNKVLENHEKRFIATCKKIFSCFSCHP